MATATTLLPRQRHSRATAVPGARPTPSPIPAEAVIRPCLATPGLVHAGHCDCFRGRVNAPWRP